MFYVAFSVFHYIVLIVLSYKADFNQPYIANAALPKQVLILEEHQCEPGLFGSSTLVHGVRMKCECTLAPIIEL